jgi:pheromone shutdown protein TraB
LDPFETIKTNSVMTTAATGGTGVTNLYSERLVYAQMREAMQRTPAQALEAREQQGEASLHTLPSELTEKLRCYARLENKSTGAVVHLVGTAPGMPASTDDARRVCRAAKPDTVFVELCDERAAQLWQRVQPALIAPLPSVWDFLTSERERRADVFPLLGSALDACQRAFGSLIGGNAIGTEMVLGGAHEAVALRSRLVLMDRALACTTRRAIFAWARGSSSSSNASSSCSSSSSSSAKPTAMSLMLTAAAEQLLSCTFTATSAPRDEPLSVQRCAELRRARGSLNTSMGGLLQQAAQDADATKQGSSCSSSITFDDANVAGAYAALVDERDEIMAHRLFAATQQHKSRVAVAIVGAEHVAGIKRRFGRTSRPRVQAMLRMPARQRSGGGGSRTRRRVAAGVAGAAALYGLVRFRHKRWVRRSAGAVAVLAAGFVAASIYAVRHVVRQANRLAIECSKFDAVEIP